MSINEQHLNTQIQTRSKWKAINLVIMTLLCILVASWAFIMPWILSYLDDPVHSAFLQRDFLLLVMHVLAGGSALILGAFQLLFVREVFVKKWVISLHKAFGKLYVISIIISTIGGVYLAFYAYGGLISTTGLLLLNVLWISSTLTALYFIKQGNVPAHKKWMIRSFALTFAAVTLRIEMPILSIWFDQITVSQIVYWSCWTVNLLIVECWFKFKENATKKAQSFNEASHV